MTASCDATLVRHETASQGPLTFELWVSKEFCAQPMPETTMLSEAPLLVRVTNNGPDTAQLVAADPDALFVTRVWDADRPDAPVEMDEGPEPDEVPTVTVDIASGASWDSTPITGYLNAMTPDILNATRLADGVALDPALKLRRVIGLEARFAASVNTGAGFVPVQQLLKGSIEAVLLPYAP